MGNIVNIEYSKDALEAISVISAAVAPKDAAEAKSEENEVIISVREIIAKFKNSENAIDPIQALHEINLRLFDCARLFKLSCILKNSLIESIDVKNAIKKLNNEFLWNEREKLLESCKKEIEGADTIKQLDSWENEIRDDCEKYKKYCLDRDSKDGGLRLKDYAPYLYGALLSDIKKQRDKILMAQPTSVLQHAVESTQCKMKELSNVSPIEIDKLEKNKKFLEEVREIWFMLNDTESYYYTVNEFLDAILKKHNEVYGQQDKNYEVAFAKIEELTGYQYLLNSRGNNFIKPRKRTEQEIFDTAKCYDEGIMGFLDQEIDKETTSLSLGATKVELQKLMEENARCERSAKEIPPNYFYPCPDLGAMKDICREIYKIDGITAGYDEIIKRFKGVAKVDKDGDLEFKEGDDGPRDELKKSCKDYIDATRYCTDKLPEAKENKIKKLIEYIDRQLSQDKTLSDSIEAYKAAVEAAVAILPDGDGSIGDQLRKRLVILNNLKAKAGFTQMCDAIYRLEAHSDRMKSSWFTTGTDEAKKACNVFTNAVKSDVFKHLKSDGIEDLITLADSIKNNTDPLLEKTKHRNVFIIVAEFLHGIFKFCGRGRCLGGQTDFFKPKRKELGEAVLAQAARIKTP